MPIDVEHAAPPVGAIAQGTLSTPQARYEGFEPLPADLDDGLHVEMNVVRIILTLTLLTC